MNILSIETSADETAVSLVRVTGEFPDARYELLGNALRTQIEMHRQYGGIFPTMAKREHAKALTPLLKVAMEEAELSSEADETLPEDIKAQLETILEREPELFETLVSFLESHERPTVDLIAVTSGPGLEPALWVGVNFAKALALAWDIQVVPVNHMEGHVLASIYDVERDEQLSEIEFPAIALLISGGHTELVLMKNWGSYEKVGQTRDDAVGEAFDKVARLMDLPYPGGPEISRRAGEARAAKLPEYLSLPRPMLNSDDLDFSFSGIKTAVRYGIEGKDLSDTDKQALSRDFEDAVAEVLIKKAEKALEQYGAKTLVVGGGVSANSYLREEFQKRLLETVPDATVYFPERSLSTDNSIMIALAGHARAKSSLSARGAEAIRADGNRSLSSEIQSN